MVVVVLVTPLQLRPATGKEKRASAEGPGSEMTSICIPQSIAPEIVPVILAFLYTDRLENNPENGPNGFAEAYHDPCLRAKWKSAIFERCRDGSAQCGGVNGPGKIGEWPKGSRDEVRDGMGVQDTRWCKFSINVSREVCVWLCLAVLPVHSLAF